MDGQKKPRARKVTGTGTGNKVEKQGQGLGTGPVNNMGNYEDRRQQAQSGTAGARPAAQQVKRPGLDNTMRPGNAVPPFSGQRPANGSSSYGQRPVNGSSYGQRPASVRPERRQSQGTRASGSMLGGLLGGGSSKILLIVVVLVLVFFGSKLFGGGDNPSVSTNLLGNTADTGITGGGSALTSILSSFLGGNSTSTYDFGAGNLLSSITGQSSGGTSGMNTAVLNRDVAPGSRSKMINVNRAKNATILVYMCGTDLESQNGMATADIQEMMKAGIGDHINLLIYTGGCAGWRNSMFSRDVNQIYQISGNNIKCLENNMGRGSMTDPATLQSFIEYGRQHYPADRMCLIMWDHGGGSVTGFGYDEKTGRGRSMTLAGIKSALDAGRVKFDFIGFDACLMATVENGLMLSNYADYMIASEETEPGVGWYYTNWLKKLSDQPNMPTIDLGKLIADDFVEVCAKQCRGQATTLSVVDLAELGSILPKELSDFSVEAGNMIQNKKEYKTVASARSNAKEFAQSSGIDQIDLYDFADKLNRTEANELKQVLKSAVKYNRTGGGIGSSAHGLSIYFPYKKAGNVKNAVSTYQNINMDEDYTRCIQAFASLEASGQVAAVGTGYNSYYGGGSPQSALPGLMQSLMGGGNGSYASYGDDLTGLIGSMIGGGSGGSSLFDLIGGRSMSEEDASAYVTANHIDDQLLTWKNGTITLPEEQADLITDTAMNVFFDDGEGYIDLGMDNIGLDDTTAYNVLAQDPGTIGLWLHFDNQPVAFYYMYMTDEGDAVGYVPALLNDSTRVNLLIYLEGSTGSIIGAQIVYPGQTPDVEAKNLIGIGSGDKVTFLCDYYGYNMVYQDSYKLGSITLTDQTRISYKTINEKEKCRATWCLTDIYNVRHWTQAVQMSAEN